ncbi:hypothetical protein N8I77_007249 [Diaporthe amygdali]|uniref:C2H2-type domain-containing protein n=1 Tax=Phomopsis amygdali TaxID=1214568 RepID=A0AAD9SBA1_PHOAM|nr:hypothetical protein N8I77_007249 [Diaporthe amygdali]
MVVDEALPFLQAGHGTEVEPQIEGDSVDEELAAMFDGSSEDGFDSSTGSRNNELTELLSGIGNVIDCLLRFSVTISNPAPHDHFKSRAGVQLTHHFEHYDTLHVRSKYPDIQPNLSERLGRMLAYRRRYFKYREDHHTRLKQGLEGALDDGASKGLATTIASSLPQDLKDSTLIHLAVVNDDRSEISATSYATSTLGQSELRVPPIPKQYVEGPFLCPFCYVFISVDSRHDWKKHVFRDLRPYACLVETCVVDHDFQRRKDWTHHMLQDHWRTWTCPFRCVGAYSSSSGLRDHLHKSHITEVVGQDVDAIVNLSSTADISRAKGPCPLCGFEISSSHQYQSHLGHHLEQLALFVLPTQGGEEEEDDDDDDDQDDNELGDDESVSSQDINFETEDTEQLSNSAMPTRAERSVYTEDADEDGNPIHGTKTYAAMSEHNDIETKETRRLYQLDREQEDEQVDHYFVDEIEDLEKEPTSLITTGSDLAMHKAHTRRRGDSLDIKTYYRPGINVSTDLSRPKVGRTRAPPPSRGLDKYNRRVAQASTAGMPAPQVKRSPIIVTTRQSKDLSASLDTASHHPADLEQIEPRYKSAPQYQVGMDGPTDILTADSLRRITRTPGRGTKSLGEREESAYLNSAATKNSTDSEDMTIVVKGMGTLTIGNAQLDIKDGDEISIRTNSSDMNSRYDDGDTAVPIWPNMHQQVDEATQADEAGPSVQNKSEKFEYWLATYRCR